MLLLLCLAWSLIMNGIIDVFSGGVMTAEPPNNATHFNLNCTEGSRRDALLFSDTSLKIAGNYCSADLTDASNYWSDEGWTC